jgi:Bifunctional DNA primase/polymerase, N-terminal
VVASVNSFERVALGYAASGAFVLPLEPGGKKPLGRLVRKGLRGASRDPVKIREWWSREPMANVGVVCGPSSFDVLDVDGEEGMTALSCLISLHGRIVTRTYRTPRGWHLLFKPGALPTTTGKIGPGLDTRGAGTGYIVAPPSRNGSGVYREAVRADLAEAPAWLVERARAPKPTSRTIGESVARVREAPEGTRNTTLNREVFLASKDAASASEAEKATARLAAVSTLPKAEAERTTRSALGAGLEAARRQRERFRRVPVTLMLDSRFTGRTAQAKLIALYVCTGPDSTVIPGVAVTSLARLAASASLSDEATRHALRELSKRGLLWSDLRAGVLWLPSVTERFRPDNPNVARAWSNALSSKIPRCSLWRKIGLAISVGDPGHSGAVSSTSGKRTLEGRLDKEEGSTLRVEGVQEPPSRAGASKNVNAPGEVPDPDSGAVTLSTLLQRAETLP